MAKQPPQPLRTRAYNTPSPCCRQPLAAMVTEDAFVCSKCSKRYSIDQVMDLILDTAAKPAPGRGPTSIGIDDDDDLLDHVTAPHNPIFGAPPPPKARPKMVPLSRTLNTYAVKEELKAQCGARWDHVNKQWMVPDDKFALAHQIVTRGPAKKPTPPPNQPFTKSKFGGLDLNDITFDEFQKMSWEEHQQRMHEQSVRQAKTRQFTEVRTCWECGKEHDEADVKARGGVWEEFWCGCSGK